MPYKYAATRKAWNDKRYAAFRAFINKAKDRPCADCGVKYPPYVMDFDHKRDKVYTIARRPFRSLKTVQAEIDKCDVVCANCHRARTYAAEAQSVSATVL